MRLLVVEDEKWIRARIVSRIRDRFSPDDIEITEASSSWELKSQLADHPPDAILLDVNIRGEDGLKVIEQIGDSLTADIVLVTGARTFEVAHRAIQMHAVDYITKPIDFTVLDDCILRLLQRNKGAHDFRNLVETIIRTPPDKQFSPPGSTSKILSPEIPLSGVVITFNQLPLANLDKQTRKLEAHIRVKVGQKVRMHLAGVQAPAPLVIILSDTSLESLRQAITSLFIGNSTRWWASVFQDVCSVAQLYKNLHQAIRDLQYSWYVPTSSFIEHASGSLPINDVIKAIDRMFQTELTSDLILSSDEKREAWATRHAMQLFSNRVSPEIIKQCALSVVKTIQENSRDHRSPITDYATSITEATTFKELVEHMSSLYRHYGKVLNDDRGQTTTRTQLVRRAERLVKARLKDPDLSASSIAEELGVSRSYFSTRFSNEMGTHFNQYVQIRRIEHAVWLMHMNKDWTIKRIAYESGFSDVYYFSRIFKRHVGRSPGSERRNQSMLE